jgi:hypothetical protein
MPPILQPAESREETERSIAEDAAIREQLESVQDEKRRALREPGPSWKDWWYYSASKWYIALGLLILDAWVLVAGIDADPYLGSLVVLPVVYGEFLLYQYLYHRPRLEGRRSRSAFRRTWYRPVEVGRWTPEAAIVRAGGQLYRDEGPTLDEFA